MPTSTLVRTTTSPFKVTPLDSNRYEIIEKNQPISKSSRMLVSGKKKTKFQNELVSKMFLKLIQIIIPFYYKLISHHI